MVTAARVLWLVAMLAGCHRVFGLERHDAAPDAPLPAERWLVVGGGNVHSCGIRLDRTLWCWGRNDQGQTGRGSTAPELENAEPVQVGSDADWESLEVGVELTCAIKADRTLWCWGRNDRGQLGDGTRTNRERPVQIMGAWTAVSAGRDHTCAIDEAEALWCWGHNGQGQLGTGMKADSPVPILLAGGGAWKLVRAGESSTCGIRTDGTLWCWGSNNHGRLGLGDSSLPEQTMQRQVGSAAWTALALAHDFACAIRDTGALRCWGYNGNGQHGDRTLDNHSAPNPVDEDQIMDWKAVEVGTMHTCAIHGDGELACWGANALGQLGSDLARRSRPIPTPVEGGEAPWAAIGLGTRHSCAIDVAGELWCTGHAANGALGTGEGSRREPTQIEGSWERPTAGEDGTCAFARGTQSLHCWGANESGLLGDTTTFDRQTPGSAMTQSLVTADLGDHGCAIDPQSLRWCWGKNNDGQVGNNATANALTPLQLLPGTWTKISASRSHNCGITPAQELLCWGRSSERQTGVNQTAPVLVPTIVAGMWKDVGTGIDFTCGLRADDKPYCWGHPGNGQLGTGGGGSPTHLPQAVTTALTFASIAVGARHACALTAAGSAWCWGWNQYGQIGDGVLGNRGTPVQLAGTWRSLALGEEHSCGIRSDGTLWCWGRNQVGQVGDGTLIDRIDPAVVSSDTDWSTVTAAVRHSCASKADGRTYCWGGNYGGALGDGLSWRGMFVRVTR